MDAPAEVSEEVESSNSHFEILANQFPLVCREILTFLDAKDLKECFLVSKQCNAIIGAAPKCMEKFVVNFDNFWEEEEKQQQKREKKEGVFMSHRKYQNIKINSSYIDRQFEDIFKKGKSQWKSVNLAACHFKSEKSFTIVIESICETVKELTWIQNRLQNVHNRTFNFLELETLHFMDLEMESFPNWFTACKTLTNFTVLGEVLQVERIKRLLLRNPELKVVKLEATQGPAFGDVFDEDFWKKVPFQLDKLYVNFRAPPPRFMAHFLEKQINSLKILSISSGFDLICLEMIFRMGKLQMLEILNRWFGEPWLLEWNELVLPQNTTIESLEFKFSHDFDVVILEAFVRRLPNIKHLRVNTLNDRIIDFLSANLRTLESINCYHFQVSAARVLAGAALPNLKKLNASYYDYTEEELVSLRTEPTNRNQVHMLLRDQLQYRYGARG